MAVERYDENGDLIMPELFQKMRKIMIQEFLPYNKVDAMVLAHIEDSCTRIYAMLAERDKE